MIVQPEKFLFPLLLVLLSTLMACSKPEPTLEERLAQAQSLQDTGELTEAIERFEALSSEFPERVDILESLAFAYIEADQQLLAGFTFTTIAEMVESAPEYRIYAAESFASANDRDAMLEQYRAYLQAVPNDRSIWLVLAETLDEAGNRSDALDAYLRVDRLRADGSTRIRIGQLYLQADNLSQAQNWFARALNDFPHTEEEALYGLFETAWLSRRFADAEQLLEALEEINPQRVDDSELADAKEQLREWRRRQDEAAAAAAAIAERREREAEDDRLDVDLAEAAATTQPDETETVVRERERPPRGAETTPSAAEDDLRVRARAAFSRGDASDAVRLFRQALVDHPDDATLWRQLSDAALQTGDTGWAQAAASEALRLDPDNPRTVLQYIRANSDQWPSDRWLREMENAYRRFPRTPEIILHLARGYLSLENNRRSARLLFDEFLRIAPEDHPERPMVEAERSRL